MFLSWKPGYRFVGALAVLFMLASSASAAINADGTLRVYRMGEFSGFGATEQGPANGDNGAVEYDIEGTNFPGVVADGFGIDGGFFDFIDLTSSPGGNLVYDQINAADLSNGHPGSVMRYVATGGGVPDGGSTYTSVTSTYAVRFDGVDDYLEGPALNTISEDPIMAQGSQMWVYVNASALGTPESPNAGGMQILYDTTNAGGPGITSTGMWSMINSQHGADVDQGLDETDITATVPVVGDTWHHVAHHIYVNGDDAAPVIVPGSGSTNEGSAVVYVNGVAVAANNDNFAVDGHFGGFKIGAADVSTSATFGETLVTAGFFSGSIDEVEVYTSGDNEFVLFLDNGYIRDHVETSTGSSFSSMDDIMGDINLDGSVDGGDITAFVNGWLSEKVLEGAHADTYVGDLETWGWGDLNLDGRVNLSDAFLLHEALAASGGGSLNFDLLNSQVPEPSSVLMVCGALALGFLRIRK